MDPKRPKRTKSKDYVIFFLQLHLPHNQVLDSERTAEKLPESPETPLDFGCQAPLPAMYITKGQNRPFFSVVENWPYNKASQQLTLRRPEPVRPRCSVFHAPVSIRVQVSCSTVRLRTGMHACIRSWAPAPRCDHLKNARSFCLCCFAVSCSRLLGCSRANVRSIAYWFMYRV